MFGRGYAAMAKGRLVVHEAEQQARIPVAVSPQKSTIEDAYGKAHGLVEAMTARKAYWEGQIRNATEELRQAEIVLEGATQLLHTVESGMRHAPMPIVHDEIDMTQPNDVNDDFLADLLRQ